MHTVKRLSKPIQTLQRMNLDEKLQKNLSYDNILKLIKDLMNMIENIAKPDVPEEKNPEQSKHYTGMYGIDFANNEITEFFEKMAQPNTPPSILDLEGLALVSPLGPLTESFINALHVANEKMDNTARDQKLREALSKASTSVSKLADTFKECTPLNTPKVLEALNSPNNQTTITFQHDPAEGIERFKLIAVKNVLDFYSLPMLYLYGRASFYVTGDLNSINKCLTVRYQGLTRKYVIGKSVVEKKELAWIIKTMKIGGECLVEVNKKVKKASLKAGKTFTVTI